MLGRHFRDLLPRVQRMGKDAEVRYFNDVRKCIRDTFRHVCEEETVTCPEIERRLCVHRKEYHSPCQNRNTGKSLNQRDSKICCNCKKPLPCQCLLNKSFNKQQKNKMLVHHKFSDQHTSFTDILHQKVSCCRLCKKEKEYEEKLLKQALEWLQEIPVDANCSSYDKNRRQEIVRKLVDTLLKYTDVKDKQKEEIKKCLDILPMWQPIDQYDRDLFKNKLTERLLSRLCILSNNDKYLKEIVSNWIDELLTNQEPVNNSFVNKEHIINKFVTQIQSLTSDETSDEQYFKEKIKSIVMNLLKNTPIESVNHDISFINRAADKLVKDITLTQPVEVSRTNPDKNGKQYRTDNYGNQVSKWNDNKPNLEISNTITNLNKSEEFDRNHNIENNNVTYKIKNDIKKNIDIIKKGNLDSRTESLLLEQIKIKLEALPEDYKIIDETNVEKQYFKEKINSPVTDLIKNTPIESINQDINFINRSEDKLVNDITSIQSVKVSTTKPDNGSTQYRKDSYENQVSKWMDNHQNLETANAIMNLNKSEELHIKHDIEGIKDDVIKIIDIIKKEKLDSKAESLLIELITKLEALPKDCKIIEETNVEKQYFKDKIKLPVTDIIKNTPKVINNDASFVRAADKLVKDVTSIQPVKVSTTKPDNSGAQYKKDSYENRGIKCTDNNKNPETQNTIMNLNKSEEFDRNHNIESVNDKIKGDIKKITDIIKKDNLDSRTESLLIELISIKLEALPKNYNIFEETNVGKPVLDKVKQIQNNNSMSNLKPKQHDNFKENPHLQGFIRNKISLKDEITNTISTKNYKDELSLNDSGTNLIQTDASFSKAFLPFSELSIRLEKDIQSYVKEQVSKILNEYSVDNKNRKKIENKFTNILTDQIMRGHNNNNFKEMAYSTLQEINLPDSKLGDLYKSLLQFTKEMSLSFNTKTSSFVRNINTDVPKEREKDDSLINIEREITSFISEITGNFRPELVLKLTAPTKHLAAEIKKVLSNFKHSIKETKDTITKLIFNFLKNQGLPTDAQTEKLAKILVKQLLKISLHTSTPTSANENSFLSTSNQPSTISSIRIGDKYFDTLENESLIPIYESAESYLFVNEIENLIGSWMRNTKLKRIFSKAMINNIISDIIRRKRYLQLNSEIQTSYDEEHKFLKLLFAKWMDNSDSFSNIDFYIDSLVNQIIGLYMPEVTNDLKLKNDPITVTSMEVLKWIQKLPPDHLVSHDNNYHKLIAKEMAKNMRTAMNQNSNPELFLENEIEHWLPKIVKVSYGSDFHGLTVNLKDYIKEDVLQNLNLPKYNNQSTKNINDAIMKWLKSSPIYQRRNTQEKLLQENLMSNLSRDLNHIISSLKPTRNIDDRELILKLIETQLKQFPVDPTIRYDDKYHRKTALEILNHLKNLGIFRNSSTNIVTIKDNISDWLQNIPLRSILSPNNEKAAVNEIYSIFSEYLDSRLMDTKTVQHHKNKIINVLKSLPLGDDLSNDKLQTLVDNLFEILKCNSKETSLMDRTDELEYFKENTKKLLIRAIEKWCERFPINIEDNSEDKAKKREIKDRLISGLVNVLNNLTINSNLVDDLNAFENLLKNEIGHLFDTLFESNDKLLPLQNDLFNITKDILNRYRNVLTLNIYKNHLRDIIDKSIPVISDFSSEQQNSLENMKEKLIEAFISLHKISNDDTREYKEKLKREVNEFCSNYLKRYPASPLEADKLCNDLYTALQNVSFLDSPKLDETQIKQIKKQNDIKTVLADLPLENIESNNLLKTKFAHFLLERLKGEPKNLEQEIIEWLKQFSFKPEHNVNMPEIAKDVIRKLGSCNSIEKYNKNTKLQSMQQSANIQSSSQCLIESPLVKANAANHSQILLQERPVYSRHGFKSVEKDLHINQRSKNMGIQTEEVRPESCSFENTHEYHITKNDKTLIHQKTCPSISCTYYPNSSNNKQSQETQTSNRTEVSPHIIVKEYYWNSTSSCHMDNSQYESQSIHSQLRRTVPSWPLPQTNISCKSPELSTHHSRSTRIPYIASGSLCPPNMPTVETELSSLSRPINQQPLDKIDDPWVITKSPSNGRHEPRQSNHHLTSKNINDVTQNINDRHRFPKHKTASCSNTKKSRYKLTDGFYLTRELPDYISCANIEKNISDLNLNNFLPKERELDRTVMCRCYGRRDAKLLQRQVPDSLKLFDQQHINNIRKRFKSRGALCPHPSAFYFS
ncbi:unnamed protein product [Parnassius apollo]|uniref:(apollo) hypothetical protein n=1 Tax=Parnassius apollo TaxID=110799 RepID=A0A8S3X7I8_PARAO|nr:unnamed protein product [Parnassius apollo]